MDLIVSGLNVGATNKNIANAYKGIIEANAAISEATSAIRQEEENMEMPRFWEYIGILNNVIETYAKEGIAKGIDHFMMDIFESELGSHRGPYNYGEMCTNSIDATRFVNRYCQLADSLCKNEKLRFATYEKANGLSDKYVFDTVDWTNLCDSYLLYGPRVYDEAVNNYNVGAAFDSYPTTGSSGIIPGRDIRKYLIKSFNKYYAELCMALG